MRQGEKLKAALQKVGEETGVFQTVRCQGLLIGCVLAEPYRGRAGEISAAALTQGLMILVAGPNVLRLAPSLLIDDAEVAEGVGKLRAALDAWLAAASA